MSDRNHALNSYNYTINFKKMVVFCVFYSKFFNKRELLTVFIPNNGFRICLFSAFFAIAAPLNVSGRYTFCKPHAKMRDLFLTG